MSKKEQAICHYWFMAEAVRSTVKTKFPISAKQGDVLEGVMHDLNRQCIWFGLLFVVIEGYQNMKTGHPSPAIDEILKDEARVDHLRRFRNAVFHFQDEPYHDKMFDFVSSPDVEAWAQSLHQSLKDYCESVFPGFERIGDLKISFGAA
jgi:hypothetical protein